MRYPRKKSVQGFIAGIEDSVSSNNVFREWARAWARRTIIQNAIRALKPHPDHGSSTATANDFPLAHKQPNVADPHFDAVLALQDFDRFVFVMSIPERYSDRSCALLLGCSVLDIRRARTRAFEQIAGFLLAARSNEKVRNHQEATV